ncbi:uromodulin-like [Pocillopora damicornis]|uniref:uromodulin-like n=1 Tax=Pocillopora damicornis TaxID=46731 RepID=UPI000F54F5FF|nr:uromodulin-like [Pocillopora damicornis]
MKFCVFIALIVCLSNRYGLVAKNIIASYEPILYHYLNASYVMRMFVEDILDCSLACLENNLCVSFNLAVNADSEGERWCDLLSSHIYNNAEQLIADQYSHHLTLKNPCTREACSSHGICSPISLREKIHKCVCYPGYSGTNCEIDPVGCTNYTVRSEPDRHTSNGRGESSDDSLVPGWYRFQSGSYTKMLDHCVSDHRCHTDITGWLNGTHPSLEDGVVNRQACFHGYYNCCYGRVQIQVRSCEGFYVYYLNPSPAGKFRYCAVA